MTPSPSIDPRECHIAVSRRADAELRRLGVLTDEAQFIQRRRAVVDSIFEGVEPVAGSLETHFYANAVVDGRPLVLALLVKSGSRRGDKPSTAIIKSILEPERAAAILASNNKTPEGERKDTNERCHSQTS
jgi:hypothetical protein